MINSTDQLVIASKQPAVVRVGVIVDITSPLVTVDIGGAQFEAGFLANYLPTEGDLVAVIRQDSSWLVIGEIQRSFLADNTTPLTTAWTPFVLEPGIGTGTGGAAPAWRVVGNRCYWRGRVGLSVVGPIPNNTTFFFVPEIIRPMDSATVDLGWAAPRNSTAGVTPASRIDIVAGTGAVRSFDQVATLPTWVGLEQVNYFLT